MKLSRDEKAVVISALSYAIAANEKWQIDAWRFRNLRKKFEDAIRGAGE